MVAKYNITEHSLGQRLDNFIIKTVKSIPKSLIYRLIRQGHIKVNNKRTKPFYNLQLNDMVQIPAIKNTDSQAAKTVLSIPKHRLDLIKQAILFETKDLLIINKPSGISVHSGSHDNYGIIDILRKIYGSRQYLELVHRLDRETSGCLMIAKNRLLLNELHIYLQAGKINKTYLALAKGLWPKSDRIINQPLRKSVLQGGERKVIIDKLGKEAITRIDLVKYHNGVSLLQVTPVTGRTHQIRVHLASTNHPIAGDLKYGDKAWNKLLRTEANLKRLFLHAASISFYLQSEKREISVQAPLDQSLTNVINYLGF